MKTEFLKRFEKDIDNITLQSVKDEVMKIIRNVEDSANISEIKGLKKLSGYKNAYRIKPELLQAF